MNSNEFFVYPLVNPVEIDGSPAKPYEIGRLVENINGNNTAKAPFIVLSYFLVSCLGHTCKNNVITICIAISVTMRGMDITAYSQHARASARVSREIRHHGMLMTNTMWQCHFTKQAQGKGNARALGVTCPKRLRSKFCGGEGNAHLDNNCQPNTA